MHLLLNLAIFYIALISHNHSLSNINISCEYDGSIKHLIWHNLMRANSDSNNLTLPFSNYTINIDRSTLGLTINVDLQYLGYSIGERQAEIGTTYVLGFEEFEGDGHGRGINNAGACDNRNSADFIDKTWTQYWQYSNTPYMNGHIANARYLAYPPDTKYWRLTVDNASRCTRIHYTASFGWTDLVNDCKTANGSRDLIRMSTDSEWINITGTFYASIVSPLSDLMDTGFYRIYQFIFSPFTIAISKSSSVISSTGINLFTMSLVAVYKEDNDERPNEDDFKLIVLTESADYLYLASPQLQVTPSINSATFTIGGDAYSGQHCIVSTHAAICTQLWEIYALNVQCPPNSFSGTYAIQWNAVCADTNHSSPCDAYIDRYGDTVLLSADLTWSDDICDSHVWRIQFEGNMNFFVDEEFKTSQNDYLYVIGEDRVYVEVVINYPSSTYSVFQLSLTNVWICTIDPNVNRNADGDEDELVFLSQDLSHLGCLNEDITDEDGPYWIIQNYNQQYLNGAIHNAVTDGSSNKVRFSFIVPETVVRDTIYVHAQITLSLVAASETRRILLNVGGTPHKANILSNPDPEQFAENEDRVQNMDQIRHFSGSSHVVKMFGDKTLRKEWNKKMLIVSTTVCIILMLAGFVGFKIHRSDPINWRRIGALIEERRLQRMERLRIIGSDRGRIWYNPVRHDDSEPVGSTDCEWFDDEDLLMSHDDGCNDHM